MAFLAPLFLGATGDDMQAARRAAKSMLDSYGARTNRETPSRRAGDRFQLRRFGCVKPGGRLDLPVNQVLRLRGNANALNRAAEQNENRLEKQLQRPPAAHEAEPDPKAEPELPANAATDDLVAFVRASWKAQKAEAAAQTRPDVPPATAIRRSAGGEAAAAGAGEGAIG